MLAVSLNPIDWFTDAAGDIVGGAADAVFNYFLDLVLQAMDWIARQIAEVFIDAGEPVFGEGAAATSSLMVYVALAVVIGSAMLQAAMTAVRPNTSSTSSLVDLPVTVSALSSVYAIAAVWLGFTDAVAESVLTDTVRQSFSGGLQMDTAIVPFMRLVMALLMVLFMLLLFVEQLIRAHLLAVVIVMLPVGVAARVWEPARYVAGAMIKIFIALSITPILTGVSMSLALANFNSAGPLDFVRMLGSIAGMAVTTLMPFLVFKLFPIGADGGGGIGLAAAGGALAAGNMAMGAAGKFGAAAGAATAGGAAVGSATMAGATVGAAGSVAAAGVRDATSPSGSTTGSPPIAASSSVGAPQSAGTTPSESPAAVAASSTSAQLDDVTREGDST